MRPTWYWNALAACATDSGPPNTAHHITTLHATQRMLAAPSNPPPCSIWGSSDASRELVEGAVYKVTHLAPDAKSKR